MSILFEVLAIICMAMAIGTWLGWFLAEVLEFHEFRDTMKKARKQEKRP